MSLEEVSLGQKQVAQNAAQGTQGSKLLVQAADLLRVLGVGRNEYIDLMNRGKAKKLMWRVSRSSIVRELIPAEPLDLRLQAEWTVNVVNLGDDDIHHSFASH